MEKEIGNDSSLDEEINEINDNFQNKLTQNFNCNCEKIIIKEKNLKDYVENKSFEEADINEIYNVLNGINKAVTLDIRKKIRNNDYNKNKKFLKILENFNDINDSHSKVCEEIISILQKPICEKILKNKNNYETPFKPLLRPKKISLVGKIFFGSPSNDFNV